MKVIEIDHCEDCVHLTDPDSQTRERYCCNAGRYVRADDLEKDAYIPDWCPLEDTPAEQVNIERVTGGWISTKDKLPEDDQNVLLYSADVGGRNGIMIDWYDGRTWVEATAWAMTGITHWMPLPEPPEGK